MLSIVYLLRAVQVKKIRVLIYGIFLFYSYSLYADTEPTQASEVISTPIEGNSNHNNYFFLQISSAMTTAVSVDYSTKEGTAQEGKDYVKTAGTATIAAGQTYTSIPVEIIADTAAEASETFSLVLSNPQGASFPTGVTEITSTRTILDDDSSSMIMSSAAFKDTGGTYVTLPLSYTCEAANGGISPLLSWVGVPSAAQALVLTMHSSNADGSTTPNFSVFNIPAMATTLAEGDFSIGTAAEGDRVSTQISAAGKQVYSAPCSGSGTETLYTFTLYALSSPLSLTSSATQAEVIAAAQTVALETQTLVTRRVRYDATSLANNLHVPNAVPSTCAEKTAHFNEYSAVHKTLSCDEAANRMDIISYISEGLKTAQANQQVQVGISRWIGRLSLPSEIGHSIKIVPSFLAGVNNNFACDGVDTLGITVDGQLILPYYKQGGSGGSATTCGPTDGIDYADRDTVVLGEVDQCYGHSPNGEGYHMHGAPVCLMDIHNPSKPIAYMSDGIPLYFGQGGGTITNTTHAISAAANNKHVTDLNYGRGLYEHLDYRPSDVIDGTNPLNACNAYDLNKDGTSSGYVYYTSKDAPYTIGCYMGETSATGNPGADNTKLVSERVGWSGQIVGEAMEGEVTANTIGTFNNKTYNITDFAVTDSNLSFLEAGKTAQVLWRVLDASDTGYDAATTCFEFRYRKDKTVTNSDETETVCSERSVPATTLDFTPFS